MRIKNEREGPPDMEGVVDEKRSDVANFPSFLY
jgi:hypothetical protein